MKSPFLVFAAMLLAAWPSASAKTKAAKAYIVQKTYVLSQNSNSAPTAAPNGTAADLSPYYFYVASPFSASASVTTPSGNYPLSFDAGGTAVNGTDYQMLSGTLVIPAGQASAKLKIVPIVESPQAPRKVIITLLPATDGSYTLGSDIKVKIKLIDND